MSREFKKDDRVYSMWFGKKEYATVTEAPRPSIFTPWHILIAVRYDNPIYSPSIKGEDAHRTVRLPEELFIEENND